MGCPVRCGSGSWPRTRPMCWAGCRSAGSVKVVYKAGPTGFGLYRHLVGHGVACVVAAPSKLQRPSEDREKTRAMRSYWPGC
jgi:hypothetical protein